MDVVILLVAAVVAGVVGFLVGRPSGHGAGVAQGRIAGVAEGRSTGAAEAREQAAEARKQAEERLRSLVEAVKRGRTPDGIDPGTPEADLKAALEQGWAPREAEREAALREAIGRVSAFLDTRVRAPLSGFGDGADRGELAERIERALGALQDLDFFIGDTEGEAAGTNLVPLAQGVAREFAADQGLGVRLQLASSSVRAVVNAAALMDALYLVLHNAGRFGGGATVDLTIDDSDGRGRIIVRDRGEGFSEEAFARAFDPFYSTSPEGLGLGLPHARKVIEEMGGRIELRNVPDGGAEVEISFPAA